MIEGAFYHRRGLIYLALVIAILLLGALNFWAWLFVRQLEGRQLEDTRRQQTSLTTLLASQLSTDFFLDEISIPAANSPKLVAIERQLFVYKNQGEIANIILVSFDQAVFMDHRFDTGDKTRSRQFPFSQTLFQSALAKDSTFSDLRLLGQDYFLTTYAPVSNIAGEALGVLIIDAPARVFSELSIFRTRLLGIGIGVVLLIALFGGLIFFAIRQLFQSESRLRQQERLAQLGQMAAMVAHEIRNPLSIIKGSAEVLKKKYAGEKNELFDYIPEEIDRLNRLVNDFLQFARQKELAMEKINPAPLIRDIVNHIEDPRISTEFSAQELQIKLNSDAFQQIMLNLLENARKATPNDGKIEVSCTRSRSSYQIQVSDTGSGMTPEALEQAFDPFFTTRATGSGLGLAITKQLIEQQNGTIQLESKPGAGTTVLLEFPA